MPAWVLAASRIGGLSSRATEVAAREKRKREEEERARREEQRRRAEAEASRREAQEAADFELARRLQREEEEEAARSGGAAQREAEGAAEADVVLVSSDDEVAPIRRRRGRERGRRRGVARAAAPEERADDDEAAGDDDDAVAVEADPPRPARSAPPTGRDHPDDGPSAPIPSALLVPSLFPFQRAALAWMVRREREQREEPLGGILADEQGLGKTVQTLALCLAQPQPLAASPVGAMVAGGRAALGVLIVAPLVLVSHTVGARDRSEGGRPLHASVHPPWCGEGEARG